MRLSQSTADLLDQDVRIFATTRVDNMVHVDVDAQVPDTTANSNDLFFVRVAQLIEHKFACFSVVLALDPKTVRNQIVQVIPML